jgi:isopenicillin-N epimerase
MARIGRIYILAILRVHVEAMREHGSVLGQRHLFLLEDGVAYLNHGSFGACPREVFEVYQRYQLELEREPVTFIQRRAGALLQEAREALGRYVGAAADELVYVTNVTMAINIVARSLALEPGDEVLTTDLEYGAMDNAWEHACAARGAGYIRRPIPLPVQDAGAIVEAVWSGVTPRTRVLYISHITSGTAMILPAAELVRRGREAGMVTVVDGAHAPGQVPLDLTALGADFYAGNCHKWMMAPKGAGYLYARREAQPLLQPLVVSHRGRADDPARWVAEQQWQGTRDLAAFLAVPAAIRFAEGHDWPAVQDACHALLISARQRLGALFGLDQLTPDSRQWFVQMALAPAPACDAGELHRRLYEEYRVEIPVIGCGERVFVRISLQGYNSPQDIDRLVEALGALAPRS